jgi:hypothetical protein
MKKITITQTLSEAMLGIPGHDKEIVERLNEILLCKTCPDFEYKTEDMEVTNENHP